MIWLLTSTGHEHRLAGAGMLHNEISIADIANALPKINRFTGHTSRPYSVAEHSLLVADLARMAGATPIVQLAALLHDAHEVYTGDVASPVKLVVGDGWDVFEHAQAIGLQSALGVRTASHAHRELIRQCDLVALATERRDLTAWRAGHHMMWPILDNPLRPALPSLHHDLNTSARAAMTWAGWRDAFAAEYLSLRQQLNTSHELATDWSAA
jgi:hypothetical protein